MDVFMPVLWMFYYFRTGGIALYLQAAIYKMKSSADTGFEEKEAGSGECGWPSMSFPSGATDAAKCFYFIA